MARNLHNRKWERQLLNIWRTIRARCYNPNSISYKDYGKRGIKMCYTWKTDFLSFYIWAIENGWKPGLTFDRVPNVGGDYAPWSCRIATRKIQANNTRRNVLLTVWGETKTLAEWADDPRCAVDYKTLWCRINDAHWTPEKAITTPLGGMRRRDLTAFGETKRLTEWIKDSRCVVSYNTLKDRLFQGWSSEEALTIPKGGRNKRDGYRFLFVFGERKSMIACVRDIRCVVTYRVFQRRLDLGWKPEDAMTTPVKSHRKIA